MKKDLTSKVVEGGFWGGFANFLNRLGALIFTILLARVLFPENFGLYSLTMSIAFVFMTFADLGINEVLIRYFSFCKNKNKKAAYFQYIFKIKIFLSLLVSFILLITAYPLSFFIFRKPQLLYPLIFSSLFIFSSSIVFFFSLFFYAVKKTKYIALGEIISQIVKFTITILIFVLLSSIYYILGIIAGLILTNSIVLLFLILWIKKLTPSIFKKVKEKIDKKQVIKFLGYVAIVTMTGILFTYIDTLMLGFFVSFSYIGYYRVAFSLIFGLISLFTYLGLVLLPVFSSIGNKRLEKAFNRSLRFILIFSIPCTFGVLALGKYIIRILYGYEYLPAAFPLYILSFLLITWIPTTVMLTIFLSKGKPKTIAKINLISLFLDIILNYILISSLLKISELWAITGAAFATIISRYFLFFYTIKTIKKKLNIKLEKINLVKPVIAGLIMFLFLHLINTFIIKDMTLVLGITELILAVFVYFIVMYLIVGITKEDVQVLRKIPLKDFYRLVKKN